jgi:hypothetical protein
MADLIIRPPTFSKATIPATFVLPTVEWLTETWHVTHSSLPMWKSKRNVRIKYTPLPPSSKTTPQESTDRLDDLVTYQSLTSTKISTIAGVDSASGEGRGEWDWRGKGWLKVASSHWEVLGWGEEVGTGNKWVVTCFGRGGLQVDTVDAIKKGLAEMDDGEVRKMAGDLFELTMDDERGEE